MAAEAATPCPNPAERGSPSNAPSVGRLSERSSNADDHSSHPADSSSRRGEANHPAAATSLSRSDDRRPSAGSTSIRSTGAATVGVTGMTPVSVALMTPMSARGAGGGFTDESHDVQQPTRTAKLKLDDGREIELQVLQETMGNAIVLDARTLYSSNGVLLFDPGFNSTCSCASAITYIDGEQGVCLYRGYPVHELTAHHDFLDVCHLLLYGELPSTLGKKAFERQVKDEMLLHNRLRDFVNSFVPGAHPMSILASVVSAFASFYADPMSVDHINSYEERELACVRLIAKMPTIVAMAYKTLIGEPLVYPRADLSYSENFIHMMFSKPIETYRVNPLHAKIIDTFLIIHADHEQNASTSTVRTAGSSLANPYACIATGITSLWGRAHGGANEAVVRMLSEIGTADRIPAFVEQVKRKEVRLMGFGHRVYKNYDPRATLMRDLCYQLKDHPDSNSDDLFDLALKLEQVALNDEYFVQRKLYPNVDFYSGIVMRALEIPIEMFTAMFSLGRCVGWLAHWKEMVQEGQLKIARPRQLYLGERIRHLSDRKGSVVLAKQKSTGWDGINLYGGGRDFHRVQAALVRQQPPTMGGRFASAGSM